MAGKKEKKKKRKKASIAETADRHKLYEMAVQYAPSEIDFVDDTFEQIRGYRAKTLREDFCGTANVCCEWVKRRESNHAIGVDIDGEVLQWGRDNNLSKLSEEQQQRILLLQENVLEVKTESPEIISAMNFSYWLFKERADLKHYFHQVHSSLAEGGIFFLDAYGGYESFSEVREEQEIEDGDFTYTWEQESFDPITHNLICNIHFDFRDGSSMEKAFRYDWRLWILPEVQDLLKESGFSKVTVYWQGWDEDGEPDGEFKPAERADADAGWICYLTAEK
jgi:hypothetical protein